MTNTAALNGYNSSIFINDHDNSNISFWEKAKKFLMALLDDTTTNPCDLPPAMKSRIGLD